MSVALSAECLPDLLAKHYYKTRGASASLVFRRMIGHFDTLPINLNSSPEIIKRMCSSSSQIEAIKQNIGRHLRVGVQVRLFGSRLGDDQRGFTLIEMIMVMVIVGILAVVAAPRFLGNDVFQSRGFADQVQATLRYAQKEAVAQRSLVCVTIAPASVTLAIASSSAAAVCTPPLVLPAGGSSITAPTGVTFASYTSANFNFDALGRTATRQTIVVNGASNNIIVEAETGYVHSP